MANEVRFDVVAKDSASKTLDDVADKAEKVEQLDPTVTVGADTGAADHTLAGLDDQLAKLTAADQIVVLALRAGAAQSELTDLAGQLATIDKTDPNVDVTFDRFAQVSGQLDDLNAKIKSVADADPDAGAALEKARGRLEAVGGEASKAQDAVHSMAGNAVGDMAAMASGVGPVGEAVGQLVEGVTAGEIAFKDLGKAALGLGAITAGILAVNSVIEAFQQSAKRASEIEAFNVKNAQEYVDAVEAGNAAVDHYVDTAKEARGIKVAPDADDWNDAVRALGLMDGSLSDVSDRLRDAKISMSTDIQDISDRLDEAGLSARDFYTAASSTAGLDHFRDELAQANVPLADQAALLAAAYYQARQYATGAADAAQDARLYGTAVADATDKTAGYAAAAIHADDALADATESQRQQTAETARWQGVADAYAKKVDRVVDALDDMRTSTDDTTAAFDRMSGNISADQSLIDLRNQLADVATAGHDAMVAQADADKARASNAKDADEKAAAAAQAMRDYETAVNSAKLQIIDIGKTAGATTVDVDSTLNKLDQGDLDATAAAAEAFYKRNPVNVEAHLRLVAAIGAGLGKGQTVTVTGTAAAVPAVAAPTPAVTNVFLARPAAARESARLAGRHARVNGR